MYMSCLHSSQFHLLGGGKTRVTNPWPHIDRRLRQLSMVRIPVPGDGSCQFHAVSRHVPLNHMQLRLQVAQYFHSHMEQFCSYFINEDNMRQYLRLLKKPQTWGDNLTLYIAAQILHRDIMVAQPAGVITISSHQPDPNLAPIWVAYDGSSHYDAVVISNHQSSSTA